MWECFMMASRSLVPILQKIAAAFVCVFSPWGLSEAIAESTPAEWLKEVDKSLNPTEYESYRKIINIDPSGKKTEFVIYTIKKGIDKLVALFLEPASDKGRTTLRLGENMWLYIPSVGKPIRITSMQSVTGGVFNNADIFRVDYATDYQAQSIKELDIKGPSGKNLVELHLKAKSTSVAYDVLEVLLDPEKKQATEIRAKTSAGMLIKTLRFKEFKDFGKGISRPAVVETDSPLQKGYRSVMIYAKISPRKVNDDIFSTEFMGRIESLRKVEEKK